MAERKRSSEDESAESGKRARTQIEPNKIHLYRLYGKNYRSQKKIQVVDELRKGKSFAVIARELGIAKVTVEIYAIDSFAANAPLDETMLARHMKVNPESFKLIKGAIEGCKDGKLRTIKDQLDDVFSYNQIRLVLACMIRDLEID